MEHLVSQLLDTPLLGKASLPALGLGSKLSYAYYPIYLVLFWIFSWVAFWKTAVVDFLKADQIAAYDTNFSTIYTNLIVGVFN